MTEYTKPALPEFGPEWTDYWRKVVSNMTQAHADACVAAYKAHIRAEQEPVAWQLPERSSYISAAAKNQNPITFVEYTKPLYAQPVSGAADPVGLPAGEQTGPVSAAPTLTDEQIDALPLDHIGLANGRHGGMETIALRKFARAVLAAAQGLK